MKYAIVNGQRAEATKRTKGRCPACDSEMIAKICSDKIDHWAHKSKQNCDAWWESETPWHREWKNYFANEWQEVVHKDERTGEKHIADVVTPYGWTIEIQHSPMNDEERKSRNDFYNKIVWVVDGTRRKTDVKQLNNLLSSGISLKTKLTTVVVNPQIKNRLLNEWHNKDSLVFFDFKQVDRNKQRIIWFALPKLKSEQTDIPSSDNYLFLQAFPASWFIQGHISGVFDEFFSNEIYEHVLQYCKEIYKIKARYKNERFPSSQLSWLIND